MTEEIIVNDVNVAWCKLYDYGICDSEMAEDLNCEKNPDCYFKQLKRLEQENKELKEQLLEDKILDEHIEGLSREDIYCSALEEIREIADDTFKVCDDNCGNARKIKSIIDEINEVLN